MCEKDWEPRHPQDLIRIAVDDKPVPWSRPDNDGTDGSPSYISESVGTQETTVPTGTNDGSL